MPRRGIRILIVGVALSACTVVLAPANAWAKGAQTATITGPGLAKALHISSTGSGPHTVEVNQLADATGALYAVFRTTPSPLERERPQGALGPRYRVVYDVLTAEDKTTPVRQDVYPFARAGFVSYTPPGQRAFGKAVRSGWYTSVAQPDPGGGMSSAAATALFVDAGVPDRRSS